MANKIKNPLFRFKSTRAPQLVTDEVKENFFIFHPDNVSGDFWEAIAAMSETESKNDVLNTRAVSFSNKLNEDEVKALDNGLYEFGLFLLQNKNKITNATLFEKATGLSELSSADLLKVWDNLFYQTITLDSGYVREALIKVLLANHVIANLTSIEVDDEITQKWANSRVVLPNELFNNDNRYATNSNNNSDSTNSALLHKHAKMAETKVWIDIATQAKVELLAYQSEVVQSNNQIEISTYEAYNTSLSKHYKDIEDSKVDDADAAAKVVGNDGKLPEAPDLRLATEVDRTEMIQVFSDETIAFFDAQNYFSKSSFDEILLCIDVFLVELNNILFQNTNFYNDKLSVDGTIISKCSLENRKNANFTYLLDLIEVADNQYKANLLVDVGSDCLHIDRLTARFSNAIDIDITAFESSQTGGVVIIDLTPNTTLNATGVTALSSGEINFNNGLHLAWPEVSFELGEKAQGVMTRTSTTTSENDIFTPSDYGLTKLGIADYRVVEQTLCCYIPGEVSHIENVMAREYKERSTRRTRRSENSTSSSKSSEKENQTDTSSTSRFDMQSEISEVLSESTDRSRDTSFHVGTGASGEYYGMEFSVDASFDMASNFATSNSVEQSSSQSSSYAEEVTRKALERIVSNVKEERSSKIVEEFEEQNRHGFDNRKGAEHVSGVYRWVDKKYKNEVRNYGKRLQYEFMIPEPANFHLIAKSGIVNSSNELVVSKPTDPRAGYFNGLYPITDATLLNKNNYLQWANVYGAEVLHPPELNLTVSKTLAKSGGNTDGHASVTNDIIEIPEGYYISKVYMSAYGAKSEDWSRFYISIGGKSMETYNGEYNKSLFTDVYQTPELKNVIGSIDVAAQYVGMQGGVVSIELVLSRKVSLLKQWQLNTFNTIIEAYEEKLAVYNQALAEETTRKGVLKAENPYYHRRIEQTVLKKNCLDYLAGHSNIGKNFVAGSAMENQSVLQNQEMDQYAAAVKFFEQAFEWEIMSYNFYPFYWAGKDKWSELYGIENDDPLFKAFLQSGMAKVIITIRPGFEEALMYYMQTGLIWNGGEVPVLGDQMYLSIIDELSNPEYVLDDTWDSIVPSTLTLIQSDTIALEASGLPCYCDDEVVPEENILKPTTNPLEGLDVHIDGETP